jgi:hypothetical protein
MEPPVLHQSYLAACRRFLILFFDQVFHTGFIARLLKLRHDWIFILILDPLAA